MVMSKHLEEIEITGLFSKIQDKYYITSDDEDVYELSPIKPWDPDSAEETPSEYEENLGKKLTAKGLTDGRVIWGAEIEISAD